MTTVDAKIMTVVAAIKQSIETSGSPGLSVNAHPNAFFLNVIGAIDLRKAAELVLTRLEQFEDGARRRFEAEVTAVADKLRAELKAGAVSIVDAWARIKAKAGGELLALEGAGETAEARVTQEIEEARAATAAPAANDP